jgi:hypothetical protein
MPDTIMHDYAGMNWKVAHLKGYGFPIPDDTIYIAEAMNWQKRYETLRHELIEIKIMTHKDVYWPAHCVALEEENKKDPLPDSFIVTARKRKVHVVKSQKQNRKVGVLR